MNKRIAASAVVHATTADKLPVLCRILRHRNAEVEGVRTKRIVNDGRLNQHLRQRHIQLGNDALDNLHVLPRGIDEERTAALIGNDFCLPKQLDVLLAAAGAATATTAAAADNVLQSL